MDKRPAWLQNGLVLDTETTGLTRGSGIHELAFFDRVKKTISEFILNPNYVETQASPLQEHTRLASSSQDVHVGKAPKTWLHVYRAQLAMDGLVDEAANNAEVLRALKQHEPWLYRAVVSGKHPHLEGKPASPIELAHRQKEFKKAGISLTSQPANIQDVLGEGGPLQKAIRGGSHAQGRTVWIANAPFESKQIGAQYGAMGENASKIIKGSMETSGISPDAFYVTGAEVNLAKVKAQFSGDYTQVHKAYKKYTPKAGETAVRDIQDVFRAVRSYGFQLGLTDVNDPYFGTSVDLVSRIQGSLDPDAATARKNLMTPERHVGAEDSLLESDLLDKQGEWADALEEVQNDTKLGREYKARALKKEGPLHEASGFLARVDLIRADNQRGSLVKRLIRAEVDFAEQSETYQRGGVGKIIKMDQTTPSGAPRAVVRLKYDLLALENTQASVDHIKAENRYNSVDIDNESRAIQDFTAKATSKEERRQLLAQYLEEHTHSVLDKSIETHADTILGTSGRKVGKLGTAGRMFGGGIDVLKSAGSTGGRVAAVAVAAVTVAGMAATAMGGSTTPEAPSVVTYNYQEWMERQASFSGQRGASEQMQGMSSRGVAGQEQEQAASFRSAPSRSGDGGAGWLERQAGFSGQRGASEQMQGMSERGIAGQQRKQNTDFGSPYRGIQGSQQVFHDQELLRERENYLRQEYGATHFDPQFGLHGAMGPFKIPQSKQNTFFSDGTPFQKGSHSGLRGDLLQIDFSDRKWKMSVEDADTVVVKRGGIRGGVSSFFGMNREYSFRLAGIDAPETSHGSTSYHAPQPGAEAAKAVLANLVKSSRSLSLVYDPNQATYGRMMGVVMGDGKNLNLEMVKQGNVAALPFYAKGRKPMVDYAPFIAAETRAHQAGKGIWSQPYYQAFRDVTQAADQSVTFNTLTRKSKLVKNVWKMDMLSMMEQSQAQGFYHSASAIEASRIGKSAGGFAPDDVKPVLFSQPSSHYNTYLNEMMRDVGTWNKSHGSKHQQNKFSRKGGYGKLDQALVLDTMRESTSIANRRKKQAFQRYDSGKSLQRSRKARMAEEQRRINQRVFDSGINHQMM